MVLQRGVVSIGFAVGLVAVCWLGGWVYFGAMSVLLGIAAFEFCQISEKLDAAVPPLLLLPLLIAYWFAIQLNFDTDVVLFGAILVTLIVSLVGYERKWITAGSLAMALLGLILFGWLGGHLFQLRLLDEPNGWQWTILSLGATWLTDVGAYTFGKFVAGRGVFGRHALAPNISPAKSIEGYVGGATVGILFVFGAGYGMFGYELITLGILGGLIVLVTPCGDLAVSVLKRAAGVKDAGRLFPGHGGALDRIDTLLIGAPLAWVVWILSELFGLV